MKGIQNTDQDIKRCYKLDSVLNNIVYLVGTSYYSIRPIILRDQNSYFQDSLSAGDSPRFNAKLAWRHILGVIQADIKVVSYFSHVLNLRKINLPGFEEDRILPVLHNLQVALEACVQSEQRRLTQFDSIGQEDSRAFYIRAKEVFDVQNKHHKTALEQIHVRINEQVQKDVAKLVEDQCKANKNNNVYMNKYNNCMKEIQDENIRVKEVMGKLRLKLEDELIRLREEKEAEIVKYLKKIENTEVDIKHRGGTPLLKPRDTFVLV